MTTYTLKQRNATIRAVQLTEIAAEILMDAGMTANAEDAKQLAATLRFFHKEALEAS